jgi:hypothetical protein
VFFDIPGRRHIWPKSAACWSPAMPAIGTRSIPSDGDVCPYTSLDDRTAGSMLSGTPNRRSRSGSQARVWMLKSIVRDALLTSVTWHAPLVSFHTSHVSTVPNASLPASARARAPGTLSSSHRILLAEKYASISSPVFS